MSEETVSAESLFKECWSDVSGALSNALVDISNIYSQADYANAAKRAEIENAIVA